ncbi:MAG: exonuclease SbcCD subunit D [Elainella sp.]
MPRFLHLADVHLGFDRYDCKERTQDFFYAFQSAIEQYALEPQVDFVLIAGDLFEHRNIQPAILNQAQYCLEQLKQAGIPVLAIEGNHDNRPYGTKTNWLRYLADWGLLLLLEPGETGDSFYEPWNGQSGGYIDLDCGVRVLGSSWYGTSAPKAIEQIAAAIRTLPPGPVQTVMMFHHGLEGQIARYQGALRYTELLPLKQAGVDYLALGHIHKNYEVEGWVFNPGSLEANSIEESRYRRGAYLVELGADGVRAELKQDYYQRSIVRLQLTTRGDETVEDLEQQAIQQVEQAIQRVQLQPAKAPVVELRIEGQVGFDRFELDVRQLQQQLQQLSQALIFLLKYEVDAVAYATPLSEDANRQQIEREVFLDLLTANNSYRKRASDLASGLIALKDLQLEGHSEADLYDYTCSLVNPDRLYALDD